MDNKELVQLIFILVVLINLNILMWKIDNISKTIETQNQTIQILIEKLNK